MCHKAHLLVYMQVTTLPPFSAVCDSCSTLCGKHSEILGFSQPSFVSVFSSCPCHSSLVCPQDQPQIFWLVSSLSLLFSAKRCGELTPSKALEVSFQSLQGQFAVGAPPTMALQAQSSGSEDHSAVGRWVAHARPASLTAPNRRISGCCNRPVGARGHAV